jgi:hypothetical protein
MFAERRSPSSRHTWVGRDGIHPDVRTATFADADAALVFGPWNLVVFGSRGAAATWNRSIVADRVPGIVLGDTATDGGWLAGIAGHLPEVPCFACATPDLEAATGVPSRRDVRPPEVSCLAGIMGSLTAIETVKLILDVGTPVLGRVLICDPETLAPRTAALAKDPRCPVCAAPRSSRSLPS